MLAAGYFRDAPAIADDRAGLAGDGHREDDLVVRGGDLLDLVRPVAEQDLIQRTP